MRRDGSGDIMRGMEIKRQKPVFKEGDIVVNARNNFRRLIQSIRYEDRSGAMKVVYTYCDEGSMLAVCQPATLTMRAPAHAVRSIL
jgi:hypothetical protein